MLNILEFKEQPRFNVRSFFRELALPINMDIFKRRQDYLKFKKDSIIGIFVISSFRNLQFRFIKKGSPQGRIFNISLGGVWTNHGGV